MVSHLRIDLRTRRYPILHFRQDFQILVSASEQLCCQADSCNHTPWLESLSQGQGFGSVCGGRCIPVSV